MLKAIRSLRVGLLLLVLAAVVPAFALVVYTSWVQRGRGLGAAEEEEREIARVAAEHEQQLIDGAHRLLFAAANAPAVRAGNAAGGAAALNELLAQHPNFTMLAVARLTGELVASTKPVPAASDLKNQIWFQRAIRSGDFASGGFEINPTANHPQLSVAFPVRDTTGAVQAVAFTWLDLDWLTQFAIDMELPSGASLVVLDRAGGVLARYPEPAPRRGRVIAHPGLMQRLLRDGGAEATELENEPRVYGAWPVRSQPAELDALILVGLPRELLLAKPNRLFYTYLAMLAGFAVATLVAAWLVANWVVLGRVHRLMAAAKRLGAGDLGARTGVPHNDGSELGELARALDEMAASLQRKDADFEQAVIAERHVEAALRESEEMFRSLSASSPLGIFMTDPLGRCTYVNPQFTAITNLGFPAIEGKDWLMLLHAGDRERVRVEWLAFVKGDMVALMEARLATTAALERWVLVRAAKVLGPNGELLGYVGTLEDNTGRRLAQQEIANWKRRYELIAAASGQVVYDYDVLNDRIVWSGSIEMVLGYQVSEVQGGLAQWLELIHRDDRAAAQQQLETARAAGRTYDAEYRFRHKLGHYVQIHDRGFFLPDTRGKAVHMIGMMEDITERKRAEAAVRESERRFRDLFENSPDAVFVEDIGGTVLDVNPAACRLHGLPRVKMVGRNVLDLVSPEQRAAVARDFPKWFTGELTYYDGLSYVGQNRIVPVEIRGTRIDYQGRQAVLLHVRDTSERRRVEEALRQSEQRLRLHVQQTPLAVIEWNLDFRVARWNPAAERIFGYTETDAIGRHAAFIVPEAQRAQVELIWRGLHDGKGGTRSANDNITKDGRTISCEWYNTPLISPDGQVIGVASLVQDVTESRRAEAELRESNQRLQDALGQLERTQLQMLQQERLRALGQMASGIAHDFNNALAGIVGFSDLLLQRPDYLADKAKVLRYLQLINTAATDAGNIVNRLKEFYRHRDVGDVFAPIDLNALIEQAISLTQPKWKTQAEAGSIAIQVTTALQPIPIVAGNATDLREALTNLILNAVDAMPHGGTIRFSTRRDDRWVAVDITDTGMGMTEDVRQHCLEPFYSTKGEAGTGLGLSMVYGILQRHEGDIDIQSQPGRGTTVTLRLPVPAGGEPAPLGSTTAEPDRALRILLVDDEPGVRDMLVDCLSADGHKVEPAADGREALSKFHPDRFDVVLVDRAMPGMSGDQIASRIKAVAPTVPVVMVSGFGSLMNEAGEKPPGVDLVVGKPVTMANLRAALAQVCNAATPRAT